MFTVIATKKQSLPHFQNMSNKVFRSWLQKVKTESNGILKDIPTAMKVDGFSAKFGKDIEGRVFLEGARTGPIFDPEMFVIYALSKTSDPEILMRAAHYKELLITIRNSDFIQEIPLDTKVYCEILYNPLAKEEGDKITFVSVGYDKRNLGSLMTILPYDVYQASTGKIHKNRTEILLYFYYIYSNPAIKFITPNLIFQDINISEFIDLLDQIEIQTLKDDLALYLLYNPNIKGKYDLGEYEMEGIVLTIEGKQYKIVTPEFRAAHRRQK